MPGKSDVSFIKVTKDVAIGTWGDFFLCEWIGDTGVPSTAIFTEELAKFAANKPNGIGLITLIRKGSKIPRADARSMMAKVLKETNILLSAAVMEGSGFRASAVRGFVQGLSMLARNQYPHHVFGDIKECSDWLATTSAQESPNWSLTPGGISTAITSFSKKK